MLSKVKKDIQESHTLHEMNKFCVVSNNPKRKMIVARNQYLIRHQRKIAAVEKFHIILFITKANSVNFSREVHLNCCQKMIK